MNETEKWYQSRGVWGAAGTIVVMLGGLLGYNLTEEDKEAFIVTATAIAGAVTGALALVGRLKASKRIE